MGGLSSEGPEAHPRPWMNEGSEALRDPLATSDSARDDCLLTQKASNDQRSSLGLRVEYKWVRVGL